MVIEIKKFCSLKDLVKERERYATDWQKISARCMSDKRLVSYIKYPYNQTIREHHFFNGQKICTNYLTKEDINVW